MDSDGDGKTNGMELGDPNCEWTMGSTPMYTSGLSHPGICDPFDSELCDGKPSFVDCEDTSNKKCPVLEEPGTFNFTVRFPETPVPAKETTRICVLMELPHDKDYHLVAYDPVISNLEVMHHTLVFACEGVDEAPGPLMQPLECGDTMYSCLTIIALWRAGAGGQCLHEDMGVLTGGTEGIKYAVMQHHWNNPELRTDYVDSSGMTFHLTPKLRPNNAGVLLIGQYNLNIPPGVLSYSETGSCHSECTKQIMDGPINIASAANHMHLLGRAQYTERIRDGYSIPLAVDAVYDYNTPVLHKHSTPILINPGDELKTTCTFESTSRSLTTTYGDATADEMCFAFITFYPKENMRTTECTAWKSLSSCEIRFQTNRRGCDFVKMDNFSHPESQEIYSSVSSLCALGTCRKECLGYVRELKKHACFSGDVGSMRRAFGINDGEQRAEVIEWYSRFDSCDGELAIEKYKAMMLDEDINAGATDRPAIFVLTTMILIISFF
ncbi:hypothetical protein ACF0H5_005042 [Mactra antiquata]